MKVLRGSARGRGGGGGRHAPRWRAWSLEDFQLAGWLARGDQELHSGCWLVCVLGLAGLAWDWPGTGGTSSGGSQAVQAVRSGRVGARRSDEGSTGTDRAKPAGLHNAAHCTDPDNGGAGNRRVINR